MIYDLHLKSAEVHYLHLDCVRVLVHVWRLDQHLLSLPLFRRW